MEDKNTTHPFSSADAIQIRRYVAGTTGYAIWTNACDIIALRFSEDGSYETLLRAEVSGLFGPQTILHPELVAEALDLLRFLLGRDRFTLFDRMVNDIAVDEASWKPVALETKESLNNFIEGSRDILDYLRSAALNQLMYAFSIDERSTSEEAHLIQTVRNANSEFVEKLFASPKERELEAGKLEYLAASLGRYDLAQLDTHKPKAQSAALQSVFNVWRRKLKDANDAWRSHRLETAQYGRAVQAFRLWRDRQPDPSEASPVKFAEQVGYVFFVRLMLARILEDKKIVQARIASDGGFAAWRDIVRERFAGAAGEIHGGPFLAMLFRKVSAYYRHFFQQAIFDWFQPDDYMIVRTLRHLNGYEFSRISTDVLGYTYEHYIDRVARNKKGHFLTKPELVDYILDRVEYTNAGVIGRKLIDPACGSGSFLVHAARRLRQALIATEAAALGQNPHDLSTWSATQRTDLARRVIEAVPEAVFGLEIDPFACYLAELNLFVQLLDDLAVLWLAGLAQTVDRFRVYNTDSLYLQPDVLASPDGATIMSLLPIEETEEVELNAIKSRSGSFNEGFWYVVSNPPYVTPKRQQLAGDPGKHPFFQAMLSGDTNMYLLFLRLGAFLTAKGGRLAYIVPLTFIADDSAESARRVFESDKWHVLSLTRFYKALVLFEGVDQHVCVVAAEQSGKSAVPVQLFGGNEVNDAGLSGRSEARPQVVNPVPAAGPWSFPFLACQQPEAYLVWDTVRSHKASLRDLLDLLAQRQGDINTTHSKPLQVAASDAARLAAYKGEDIEPFAPLPDNSGFYVRSTPPPGIKLTAEQGAALAAIQAVNSLTTSEVGFVFQETVNIPIHRRVRGAWYERGPKNKVVFMHTLWRFAADPARLERAYATFGIVTSALVCYMYALFSTNTHVVLGGLRRLPMPPPHSLPEKQLAELTRAVLRTRRDLRDVANGAGGQVGKGDPPALTFNGAAPKVLAAAALPSVQLKDAMAKGDLSVSGKLGRVSRILDSDAITTTKGDDYKQAVSLLLRTRGDEQWAAVQQIRLPEPAAAVAFLKAYGAMEASVRDALKKFIDARSALDEAVFDWYLLPTGLRNAVITGLPWEYGNR